jgi:hypothetical protein
MNPTVNNECNMDAEQALKIKDAMKNLAKNDALFKEWLEKDSVNRLDQICGSVGETIGAFAIARGADEALAELAGFLTNNGKDQMDADYYWSVFRPAYIAGALTRDIEKKSAERDFQRNMSRMRTMSENGECCRFETPAKPKKQTTAAQKMRERRANVSPEVAKAQKILADAKAKQKAADKAANNEIREAREGIRDACKVITDLKDLRAILTYASKRQPGNTVKGRRSA